MQQLSLNNIPQNLFPFPIIKSNFEIQHLQDLRNEQENQFLQDHSKLLKIKTPKRKDQTIQQKNKRQSTVTRDVKNTMRKISEYQSYSQEQILNSEHSMQNNTIDCSINYKLLNQHILNEQQFQVKQNQIQQMIKDKLYTSYYNSMKKTSKQNPNLLNKINQLAPFVSQNRNHNQPLIKRMNQSIQFKSQSIPFNPNNESVQNSIQRIQSLPRNQNQQIKRVKIQQLNRTQAFFQKQDVDKVDRKLNRKIQTLSNDSYTQIDSNPIFDYQKQIHNGIELKRSTKKQKIY